MAPAGETENCRNLHANLFVPQCAAPVDRRGEAAFPSVREVMELSVGSTSVPSGTKSSFFFNRLIFLYFIFSFSLQTVAAVRRSNHRQFIN